PRSGKTSTMNPTDSKLTRDALPSASGNDQETANHEPSTNLCRHRFLPDFDLYIFNLGEHRRAHQWLGAHLVDGGVRFAVWAPNAQRVAVVGDFNNWNIHAHAMERR